MGKKLLVADDSVTIQKVIKLALSSEGYDILAVSEGHDALRAIEEERPNIILIDIALPGKNAFELRQAFMEKPEYANTAFILMVSAFEKLDEPAIQALHFHGRLIKPFDPAHLRKVVSQSIEKAGTGKDESEPHLPPQMKPKEMVREATSELMIDPPPSALPPTFDLKPEDAAAASKITTENFPPITAPPESELGLDEIDEETSESILKKEDQEIENDIRGLTESTIKLSGLDEMEWNLDDSSKLKTGITPPPPPPVSMPKVLPVAPPPPAPPSSYATTASPDANASRKEEPTRPTLVPPNFIDDGGSNFLSAIQKELPPVQETISTISALTGATLTRKEVEDMIRKELRDSFERIAKDELPLIAERIIRKEIEKILAEP